MFNLPTVKDNMIRYIDAGFPILYIRTFEEAKADKFIEAVAGGRKVLEWNGANGFVDFQTKAALLPNYTLEATLQLLKNGKELDRKLLVIKDASEFLRGQNAPPKFQHCRCAVKRDCAENTRSGWRG